MSRPFPTAAVCFALFCAPWSSPAADKPDAPATPRLKLTTERVVIFKDGHGLVVKNATATADANGHVFTSDVPDGAILGCFWAIGQDKKILGMRAEWDEKKEVRPRKTPAITVAELLRANLGKPVVLEQTDKSRQGTSFTTEGTLAELLELPADVAPPRDAEPSDVSATGAVTYPIYVHEGVVTTGAFTAEAIAGGGTLIRELVPRGGDFVVVTQEGGRRTILPVSHVQSVSGGKDFVTTVTREEEIFSRTKRLSFDFGKESAGKAVSLKLFYFTAGLRWIPTYRVSGELKDKADLALQGEIINDVTDIEHAELDLVVGVPNFRFKDVVSPLTLEQTLRRVTVELAGANSYNGNTLTLNNANYDNGAMQSQVAGPARGAGGGGDVIAPELAGAGGEQDLFVYSMKDFSLKKHARATVPLWQEAANLRHLYTYDIRARRSSTGGGVHDDATTRSPLQITTNQVWHQLELTNTGAVPWTTGAALMLREALPLGQDLLTYTPPTGKRLPVTIAVDLRGTFDEQELDRKPNAINFDGNQYMQVHKKGTVTVTNYRKEKSDMRITVSTGGKVTAASDDGKIKLNDFRNTDWDEPNQMHLNNHSDVVWELTLEPGATKTLTYEATLYLR